MMRGGLYPIAAALSLCSAGAAQAQDADTAADRADARLSRLDRADPAPRGQAAMDEDPNAPKPQFKFSLTLPFTYNSNVENAETNRLDAFHATPSVMLDWKQQEGEIRPFARFGADLDEYTEHGDNSASTLSARFGLRIHDRDLGGFVPYVHYSPVLIFGSLFDDHQLTLHTFTAGVSREIDLGGGASLALDVSAARREASLAVAEQNRFGGTVGLSGDIVPGRISWSFKQVIQGRFYTGGANDGRHDINFLTEAGISFTLGETRSGVPITLDVGATFENNSSSRAGKDYSTFDIGPSFAIGWRF